MSKGKVHLPFLSSNVFYLMQQTRPLQISRPTPSPARPQRSQRRQHQEEQHPPPRSPHRQPQGPSPSQLDDGQGVPAIGSVVSALSAAGARRRALTNGSAEFDYQRERQAEIEAERLRQQRIRDKVPGRKATSG